MENKVRYKLHKVKKQWVTLAVASAALATIVGGSVATSSLTSAEEINNTNGSPSTTTVGENTNPVVEKEVGTTTEVGNTSNATTTERAAVTADKPAETTVQPNSGTTSDRAAAVEVEAKPETTAKPEVAAKPETATTSEVAANAGVAAPTAEKSKELSEAEIKAAVSLDNIKKEKDGKYYYLLEDGSHKKNFAITVNGQVLYFDENGALSSTSTYSFTQETTNLVTDFTKNNAAYDSTKASFELVDGYLTADSWYRPKEILEAGTTWKASTEKDFRPLLIAWWPNVDTQVNYLNYMSKVFNLEAKYTSTDKQADLNRAAKDIQVKIEQKIQAEKSTQWLRETISAFVKTQPQWNKETENYSKGGGEDHLQGGALLYVNDSRTPWANSNYRLLNRTATNQTGTINKSVLDEQSDPNHMGGFDFLLANDVDLSNPVVQAEQLNQIHYLMNWGSIVMGDKDANFDGIRVDAVDNVNADMLQLYTNYFREYYGVNKSEAQALAHISVLEAWSLNDNHYNDKTDGAALAMENKQRLALLFSLAKPIKDRTPAVSPLYNNTFNTTQRDFKTDWINKDGSTAYNEDGTAKQSTIGKYNEKYGDASGNYVFIRAHDNNVQDIIAEIIKKEINKKSDG